MELSKLLKGLENYKIKGDLELNIDRVECNSKKVKPNSLFIAIKGYDFDGHEYVNEAIENGATAIMLDMNADLRKVNLKKNDKFAFIVELLLINLISTLFIFLILILLKTNFIVSLIISYLYFILIEYLFFDYRLAKRARKLEKESLFSTPIFEK